MEAPEELDCFPDSVIGLLSPPRGTTDAFHEERLGGFGPKQANAILAFLRFFECRHHEEWSDAAPPEAAEAMAVSKVLSRAIAYWTSRMQPESVHS
jgi:hypothetical protein